MIQTNKILYLREKQKLKWHYKKIVTLVDKKHSLNNRTVHFHTQLKNKKQKKQKKVRHQKETN